MENNKLRNQSVSYAANGTGASPNPTPLFADVTRPAPPAPAQPFTPPVTMASQGLPSAAIPTATPPAPPGTAPPNAAPRPPRNWRKLAFRVGIVILILLLLGAGVLLLDALRNRPSSDSTLNNSSIANTTLPLSEFANTGSLALLGAQSLSVNGQLRANESFILAPQAQPVSAERGQLYYDNTTNILAYYNGTEFIDLTPNTDVVLTLQGQSGNVTLVGGTGIAVAGTTLVNTGVTSIGGQTGDIVLGGGLTIADGTLQNSGIIGATAGTGITITDDGSGTITISNSGAGTGTVQSPGGTPGRLAKFTGVQTIEDSLLSESGSVVTVNGDLAITGTLTLGTPLSVSNGGTGATTLANNGVLVGQGSGAITAITAGGSGLCLLSTAGAPSFQACPGGASVTSVNGLTGALNIANASGAGTTITIDDASTTQKGIAQFNNTNFTASGGTINTIQNINTGASPTFAGMTLSGDLAVNGGDITSSGALTLTASGGNVTINANGTIELQDNTNITGNLDVSGTLTSGTANAFQVAANGAITTANNATMQGGTVTVGTTSQGGVVVLYDGSTHTGTIQTTNLSDNRTYTLPDQSGTICLSTGNCAGAATTLQSAYDNSTSPEITLDSTRGALTIRDNATPLGANLLEVQNNAGSTTYFGVTASGISVTGTATVSGNINSSTGAIQTSGTSRIDSSGNLVNIGNLTLSGAISGGTTYTGSGNINTTGGSLQTAGTTRVDNSGNLTNIGNITLNGAISGGTTYTGSGNINTTGGSLQTAGTSRVDNSGNLVNIGNITGTGAITIASSGAGNDITIDGADQFIVQDAANFNALATFTSDVDMTFADTENLSISSTVTGTNSVNLIGAVLTNNTSSGTQQVALLQNASGSGATEGLLVLDNADTDTAVTSGMQITSAAGGITNALDVSDADIVTALLFGANDITGTNFSVTGSSGNMVSAGNATLQGGTVTVGTSSQGGTLVLYDGSTHTGTIQVASLSDNRTYTLPDASGTICLSTGNCAGAGGGITGSGTTNRLSKFTGTGTIGDSSISDDGTAVTTSVDVIIQGGDITVGTTSQLASLLLHDGNGQTTTLQAGNSAGNLTFILPTTAGSTNQCLKQSGSGNQLIWQDCDGGGGGSSATLQTAYANGNSITTTDGRDIDIVLSNTTTDANFDLVVADGSTSFVSLTRADGAGTADPAQMLLVDNLDTNRVLPVGIKLQAAGGGMTTAIDATDAEIVDAISVGANNIVGTTGNIDLTNFDVIGATGNITTAGDLAVDGGDITSTSALAISSSSGNISLNATGTIELQDNTNVTGNADVSGTLTAGTANAFQVAAGGDITTAGNATLQGGSVTVGTSSQGGTVVLYDGSTHTGSLVTTSLSDNRTYTLPDQSGTICLSTGNCAGATVTLQSAYDGSTNPEITLDSTRGALTIRDNATPLGANLLEVQNNAGNTTYFGVTASGISVTGTATVSGNINSSGGSLQTAGTSRVDNSGNLVNIGNITGTGAITIASSGAGNDIIINGADILDIQDATTFASTATFNGAATFNTDVDLTLADAENLSITNTVTGTNSLDLISTTLTNNTSSGTQNGAVVRNAAGSGTTEALLLLDNADTDTAVTTALQVTAAAGGVTTAIDLSDADIVDALNVGANNIVGTTGNIDLSNFDVTGSSGNVAMAGVLQVGTLGTADTATLLCRNSSNQIATCTGTGSGAAWVQGGNTFGATGVIGTNDNFGINIRVNSTTVATFNTNGSLNLRNSANSTQGLDVENAAGDNVFTVNTTNSRVGINMGGSNVPTLNGAGLEIQGGLRLSGGGSGSLTDQYTSPGSANINTKINIPNYDPGSGNTMIAAGLTSTADNNATVIAIFDARANANHWPTIAVYSPDESKLLGLTWAGSNTEGRVTTHNATGTTGGIALQSGDTAGTGTSSGAVAVRSGNGVGSNNSTGAITIDSGTATGAGTAGAINIGTSNAPSVTIGRSGASGTVTVQGGSGGVSLLSAANVTIGTSNTTGTLLVLDTKTDAGDPTGVNGGMYYNSNSSTFRCYQGGSWMDCVSSSSTFIQNQNASDQTANFRISGSGRANTSFLTPALDVAAAGTLSIGTSTATGITLGSSTNNPLITLESGTSNIDIGAGHFARTIRFGTGNAIQNISIGGSAANQITLGNAQTGGGVSIGTNMTTGSMAIGGGTISIGAGAQARIVTLGTGAAAQTVTVGSTNGASSLTLQAGTGNFVLNGVGGTTYTMGAATTTGTISLGGTAQTGSITIGGGTGAQSINVGTGGTGAKTVTVGSSASTGLTTIQGGTGGVSLLSGANVTIGTSDTTGTLLVLDTKTDAGDPTGVNGGMYYNSNSNTFRCYENSAWRDCLSADGAVTLQDAYSNSSGSTTPEVKLDSTTGALDIQDADSTLGGNLFNIRASNGSGLGSILMSVSSTGVVTLAGGQTADITSLAVSTANGTGTSLTLAGGNSTSSTCGTACIGGNLVLQGGNATGGSGTRNGGNVVIDAGIGNSDNGDILIGTNASADITIGRTSGSSLTRLQGGGVVTLESGGTGSTSRIQVGEGGVGGATPDYLALDVKSTTGDPASGAEGYMYYNNFSNKFRCYQNTGWTDCITTDTGVTTVGTIDSQTKSSNGIVISGTSIYMQTADATNPGLVSTGTQTFAGAKTFQNSSDSANAFRVLNSTGGELVGADTTDSILRLLANNSPKLIGSGSTWLTGSNSLGTANEGAAGATVNGFIYSLGGCEGGTPSTRVQFARANSDGSTGTWSTTTSLPTASCNNAAAVYSGYIYVMGGTGAAGTSDDVYYAKVNSDGTITAGGWKTLGSTGLPDRLAHAMVAYNGYLYVIGGTNQSNTPSQNVYYAPIRADGSLGTVTTVSNWLPSSGAGTSATVANGYLYVLGNSLFDRMTYAKINNDGSIGSSGTSDADTLSSGRDYAYLTVMNGYIYTVGGGGGSPLALVSYAALNNDGSTGAWTNDTTTLPAARGNCSGVTLSGYVYCIGGYNSGGNATVYYAGSSRVKIGGGLDLTAYSGENAAEGGSGGQLTAGDTHIAGTLAVMGNAAFKDGLSVNTLTVQNGLQAFNGTVPIFGLDLTNSRVYVGNPTSDTTGAVLVLDTKSDSGDPTSTGNVDGAMYYNSNSGVFRCYEASAWHDCAGGTLGYAQVTANQSINSTPADLTGLSVTVTVPANHRIRITAQVAMGGNTADDAPAVRIHESTTQLQECHRRIVVPNSADVLYCSVVLTPSSGSHTYNLKGVIANGGAGTGNLYASSTKPAYILVEDIGK